MVRRRAVVALVCSAAVFGCGGDEPGASTSTSACAQGEARGADGTCRAVPSRCLPGEAPLAGGACKAAGVPADACGGGFTSDGVAGCAPILPPAPCPTGQIAIPGDAECREIAPCGAGSWGEIPVESSTEYVSAAYAGQDSDGSAARPWTKIGDGIDAAASGAIVAVADGVYAEDVKLTGKPVRLWGRCPAKVTVDGVDVAVEITQGGGGAEVHDIALTGGGYGLAISGAEDVRLSRLWVHHTGLDGMDVQDVIGPASVILDGSLFEATRGVAMFVDGPESRATVGTTAVRATIAAGGEGSGLHIQQGATVMLARSLIEQSTEFGVYVFGSTASVETTVVRGTARGTDGAARGIDCTADLVTGARAALTLATSRIEDNEESGILIGGCDATVDATVVRANGTPHGGAGIGVQDDVGGRGSATIRASLVEGNVGAGILVIGADATIHGSAVRDSRSDPDGHFGTGIDVGVGAVVALEQAAVELNQQAGVLVYGSSVSITETTVRGTTPNGLGRFGDGVVVLAPPDTSSEAHLTHVVITESARAGLSNFGAHVTLEATSLSCNAFDLEGEVVAASDFAFDSLGGNACGCPDALDECKVLSGAIDAPEPGGRLGAAK